MGDSLGNATIDDVKTANILNEYFGSVFTRESNNIVQDPVIKFTEPESMKLLNVNIKENVVENKLCSLNVNKSPDSNDFHPKFLFEIRKEICGPLTFLFNQSLKTGHVPNDWREANVVPLCKKGKKDDPKNYRPISLTSIFCKMMESILKDEIVNFLEKNLLLKIVSMALLRGDLA